MMIRNFSFDKTKFIYSFFSFIISVFYILKIFAYPKVMHVYYCFFFFFSCLKELNSFNVFVSV